VGWAESHNPNLNPNPNLILLLPAPHLAFHRPKSKELSAFPKSYPLRNRASGDEIALMLKDAPSQLAEAVAAGGPCGALGNCACGHPPQTNSSQYASRPTVK
jgi:hypothetical protein